MEQFGKYTLIRKIGTGGMAEVYLARTSVAQGLNKTLVIKKIHSAFARSRQFVTMFVDEAKIALGLNHPNIIQVFDFGAVADTYFLAMEYVEGMDLLRLLQEAAKARVRLPYGLSAYIVQQIAKGLDYAHRKTDEFGQPLGIVHRDISPQNILLSWDGSVKIVDFGIARARDVHEEQGVIKGKFAYMSPEQARGEPVDCRSDVFAAGIVLYELVCARPLFQGKGKDVLEMVRSGVIPRPRDLTPDVPEALERIMLRALAFRRADRFDTARDLQHELGRFQVEWAHRTGVPVDSGQLAQQLATLAPPDARMIPPRPPPAEGEARISTTPVPHSIVSGSLARDQRERKHVYVLEGILRGMAALERRLGTSGAARLVNEFYKVARNVAFKHDALLDQPRTVSEGHDVVIAAEEVLRVVIGLPFAGEDDAGRAIKLALALVDTLDGIGSDVEPELRLALAVQRGVAVLRPGTGGKLQFELEDATAAFAYRLARQARGAEILVGGRVYRAARDEWTFEALPAIDLPDVEDDTDPAVKRARVFRLRGPKERAQRMRDRRVADHLYGRELELKALRDAWRDVLVTGRKRQLAIIGDAGVGKRTLVRRFLDGIAPGEAVIVRTTARVGTAMTPYGVIADLARDVLGLAEDAEPHEVERRLLRALPLVYPEAAAAFSAGARAASDRDERLAIEHGPEDGLGPDSDRGRSDIAGRQRARGEHGERLAIEQGPEDGLGPDSDRGRSDIAGRPRARGEHGERLAEIRMGLHIFGLLLGARVAPGAPVVEAETRRAILMKILMRIEAKLEGDKPLILVGEDVHWADQDSQELFGALLKVETPRPIFGLMTARPEPRILNIAKDLGTEILHLDELTDAQRRAMLTERFVPGHDIDDLVEQIAARCGGNAFFIQEMIDTLIERGILVADTADGGPDHRPGLLRWVKRDAPLQVPSTIEDLILTRIDGLPPLEKDALVHASVLGRHVGTAALSALLGRPVRVELDELVRRGLLSPVVLAGPAEPGQLHLGAEYRFKNDMTMTVAYGLVPPDVRVHMHRAVAARIAGAAGYRVGQDDALIARHLELAGDATVAAERYIAAAGHAALLAGNADAFRQLTRALKLLPDTDHERRFTAHRLREEILRRIAKRPAQLRELHAMRKEAEKIGDAGRLAAAHCALAQFYIDVGKAPAALRAVGPAVEFARAAKDVFGEAEALRLRAAVAGLVGNADESLDLAEQALALVDRMHVGTPAPTQVLIARATIMNQRGTTLWTIGKLELAIESYAEALVIYRAIGMARNEARALNNMGIVFAALGEYEEALAHYTSSIKIDEALGERAELALKLGNIGQCYTAIGDLARAESYLRRALKIAEQTAAMSATADIALAWGRAKLQHGDTLAARQLFEKALHVATENRERYHEIRAHEYIALTYLLAGDPAETALELTTSATEWARKMPMAIGVLYGLTFQALALSRLGRHADAVAASDEALRLLVDGVGTDGIEQLLRWRSEVLAAAGDHAGADAALARCATEVATKADRLRDPELRACYLASQRTV